MTYNCKEATGVLRMNLEDCAACAFTSFNESLEAAAECTNKTLIESLLTLSNTLKNYARNIADLTNETSPQ